MGSRYDKYEKHLNCNLKIEENHGQRRFSNLYQEYIESKNKYENYKFNSIETLKLNKDIMLDTLPE